jgi:hypothetical protein
MGTLTAFLAGLPLTGLGGVLSVVKGRLYFVMGLPARSVMLPAYNIMVYLVALLSGLLGVMVRVLPFMVLVVGMFVPVLVFSWMFMVPGFMGSLKVVVIILFMGTLTAFLAGLPLTGLGGVLSVVKERV